VVLIGQRRADGRHRPPSVDFAKCDSSDQRIDFCTQLRRLATANDVVLTKTPSRRRSRDHRNGRERWTIDPGTGAARRCGNHHRGQCGSGLTTITSILCQRHADRADDRGTEMEELRVDGDLDIHDRNRVQATERTNTLIDGGVAFRYRHRHGERPPARRSRLWDVRMGNLS